VVVKKCCQFPMSIVYGLGNTGLPLGNEFYLVGFALLAFTVVVLVFFRGARCTSGGRGVLVSVGCVFISAACVCWAGRLAFSRYVTVILAIFTGEHFLDLLVGVNRRFRDVYSSIASCELACRFRVSAKDPKVSELLFGCPTLWVFYPGDFCDRALLDIGRLFGPRTPSRRSGAGLGQIGIPPGKSVLEFHTGFVIAI